MAKSRSHSLASSNSLAELVEFFDTHDMGEYGEQMPEAHFEVDIKRRTHLVAIDEDLADKLAEIAKLNHISTETLVNYWLKEKISEGQETRRP